MNKLIQKYLVRLAGEDFAAYLLCQSHTKKSLLGIGILVGFIFLLSFLSMLLAFSAFFHSFWVGVLLGAFFAWLLVNMYLLLLYTLTKNVLQPTAIHALNRWSVALRLISVSFFAVIVSKPIEHYFFQNRVKTEILLQRQTDVNNAIESINIQYQLRAAQTTDLNYKAKVVAERNAAILLIHDIFNNNNYYVQSIQKLNRKPAIWLFTLFIVLIFISPTFLKRRIKFETKYYQQKIIRKKDRVNQAYQEFLEQYKSEIAKYSDEPLTYSEPYIDPPYNYVKKVEDNIMMSQEEFLSKVYGV